MRRVVGLLVTAGLAAGLLVGCEVPESTVTRAGQPQVLTGARLPALLGVAPGRIVGFRFTRADGWTQIPVQVDERKVVPFGSEPPSNATPGTRGTVYGHGSGGPTALQYADPHTWVGKDTDPAFDRDDELVFMVDDAGGLPRAEDPKPAGVVAGSGVAVRMVDPRHEGEEGWVHLFRSTGGLQPGAGQDLVDYDFVLDSGSYQATYRRANGPNPESSVVTTDAYRIGFSDRWFEDEWVPAGGTGVDVLDGMKSQFFLDSCGRSNQTFVDGEGAFVANIDGPVRAIRSYVGANSGPLTQRTHYFYRDREVTVTDLRVHAIPGIIDFFDLSAAAVGMTYRSSTVRGGVPVDGVPDAIGSAPPAWEAVSGPQGTVLTRERFATDVPGLKASLQWFGRDDLATEDEQCWGDDAYIGVGGAIIGASIPNTDPRLQGTTRTVRATRTTQLGPPVADGAALVRRADDWAADVFQPLQVTVGRTP